MANKSTMLEVKDLTASINGKQILKGINLKIKPGKIIALMGPNGSGKSTLSQVIAGHPNYQADSGKVMWQGKNVLKLSPDLRAKMGIFLSFQYPHELPGVNMYEFLSVCYQNIHGADSHKKNFDKILDQAMQALKLPSNFLDRAVNEGFSGGEKKKSEILQMKVLAPKIAILDETDSGLDIDALKIIAKNISDLKSPRVGFLVITHYKRLLKYIKPDEVHVMLDGKIAMSGKYSLVEKLEKQGYGWLK